jgi:hypothetical protein
VGDIVARMLDSLDPRSKFAQIASVSSISVRIAALPRSSSHLGEEVEIHVFTQQ